MLPVELLILIAFFLDVLCGDPQWLPHPIRFIGWGALKSEQLFRKIFTNKTLAGLMTVISVCSATAGIVLFLIFMAKSAHPVLGDLLQVYILYASFALKDLARHSNDVFDALTNGDLAEARKRVSMIVGRQTDSLDKEGVSLACVESVSENLVDGVTAPLFWAFIGGPIGAMLYKAINTMDSLFGYKNEQYLKFGMAAARLDDLVNFIPARITAIVVVVVSGLLGLDRTASWQVWRRDRLKHASPNSAQTESAFSGALGVRMGGPNYYFDRLVDKPFIGDVISEASPVKILEANRLLYGTSFACLFIFALFRLLVTA